jgi:hypothetical protein
MLPDEVCPRKSFVAFWLRGTGSALRLVLVVALFAAAASAAPVCVHDVTAQTYACSITFEGIRGNFTDPPLAAGLPQFNPTLGYLESVSHHLSARVLGDFYIDNSEPQEGTFDLIATSDVSLYLNSLLLVQTIPLYEGRVTVPGNTAASFIGSAESHAYGVSYGIPLSPEVQAAYIGAGLVPFIISGTSTTLVMGSGDFGMIKRGYTDVTATVIYRYGVPEPAGMFLAGTGLVLLGFRLRRRPAVRKE